MRKLIGLCGVIMLFWSAGLMAKVLNVEFNFTPYLGDVANTDEVDGVAGKAKVFINEALIAEVDVEKKKYMVLFDDREISPAVWVTTMSLEKSLHIGKNKIRIEFEPTDPKLTYHAQLRWASVTDQTTETSSTGSYSATNQQDTGTESKDATGKIIFEREFNWK